MINVLERVHQMVWGPWTLVIFLGVGIFFTFKCRFFQIKGFSFWWSRTAGRLMSGSGPGNEDKSREHGTEGGSGADSASSTVHGNRRDGGNRTDSRSGTERKGKGISQFQSVCTALAATVGTGNIAGVATALTAGGPGALFWMWVSALIGMITAYAETMLGIRYRYRDSEGHYVCGPFVYMEKGLGIKWIGLIYSFLCLMCSLGMGSMVQANSAINTMEYTWHVPALAGGLVFTGMLILVTCGGIGRIGNVAEKLMPAASGIYILFSVIVIFSCFDRIPGALASMVSSAFRPEAAAGGGAGFVVSRSIRYGISRGVFSNEAGLGTLAVLHGPAENTTPHEQGMWAMFEVFFDTVILCTLTALVILCMTDSAPEAVPYEGAALAAWCFSGRLGIMGEYLVSGSMVVFAFATIMAWFYLGRQAAAYFIRGTGLGEQAGRVFAARVYPVLFLGAVFLGSEARLDVVWMLSDIWNGLMAFPNLTALLFLSGEVTVPDGYLSKRA